MPEKRIFTPVFASLDEFKEACPLTTEHNLTASFAGNPFDESSVKIISKVIKLERQAQNITQKQMAEKLNMTVVSYNRIENAKAAPSVETLSAICKALNINLAINGEKF